MRFDGQPRRRRRVGLTPLIDIVFLLLIFFMLATRFNTERSLSLSVAPAGDGDALVVRVEVSASGALRVDGQSAAAQDLPHLLRRALRRTPEGRVVVVPEADTSVQQIATTLERVAAAGAPRASLLREF